MRSKHLEIYLACDMLQRKYGFTTKEALHQQVMTHFQHDPTVDEQDVDDAVSEYVDDENDREPNSSRRILK